MQMATHSAMPGSFGGTGAALAVDASGNADGAEGVFGESVAAEAGGIGGAEADGPVFAAEMGTEVATTGFFFAFDIAKTKRSAWPIGILTSLATSRNCDSVLVVRKSRSS